MTHLSRSLVIMLLLFSSPLAFAQSQTGVIEGTLQGSEGETIPGVMITARSDSLIGGSATTYSDGTGFYRFPGLSSGMYEVQAALSGFQTVVKKELRVFTGKTLIVDFVLEVIPGIEVIEVTEEAPVIDVTTTAVAFTVPPEIIQSLPKRQHIQDLIALTPGVRDADLMVDERLAAYGTGSEAYSAFSLDGMNISGTNIGALHSEFNYNWIDEVHVTGIGAPAEYGGFIGVHANFVTRSGGNQFHGLLETFFQNEDFVVTKAEEETPFTSYNLTTQLGGPILRNKVWFFAGYEYSHLETTHAGLVSPGKETQPKFIAKLNYKLNTNNSFQGLFHRNDPYFEFARTPEILPEAATRFEASPITWNASWISLWSSQTNFEGRIGGFYDRSSADEENPDLPGHTDLSTFVSSVNSRGGTKARSSRFQSDAILSHYASDFLQGSHDFRFGVEFERAGEFSEDYLNGGLYYYDDNGAPFQRLSISGQASEGDTHRTSAFAQDDWRITDDLTLSFGFRWDHNRGITDKGVVFATDPVAPRLGFVWTLNEERQTAVKVHYGDYYDALRGMQYFFLTDNSKQVKVLEQIDQQGHWNEVDRQINTDDLGFSNLKQPVVRQFTAGIDHVLPGRIPLGAHIIYRRFGNILDNVAPADAFEPVQIVNPLTGEMIIVYRRIAEEVTFLYTNPPGAFNKYQAVEVYASKQFGNLNLNGSFVYSRQRGHGVTNTISFQFDTPNPATEPWIGNSAWKFFGTYALPWRINAGWYFRHESGLAWTPLARVTHLNDSFQVSEPCCRRGPSQNLLDLRVEKAFPFHGGQFMLTADIFNTFNSTVVLGIRRRVERPDFGRASAISPPRRIRIGLRYNF